MIFAGLTYKIVSNKIVLLFICVLICVSWYSVVFHCVSRSRESFLSAKFKRTHNMQTKNIAYHNLDITVGQGNRDEYPVSAYSTICGEDHGILRFPYSNYEELCQRVDLIYTLIREMKRGGSYHDELMIQQFGQELFESLLTER